MDLFGSAISLENDTRHNKRVGTSICNVEGFDFLGFKTESIVLGTNIHHLLAFMEQQKCKMGGGKRYEPFNFDTAWNGPLSTGPSSQGVEVFRAFMQFYARELYIPGRGQNL